MRLILLFSTILAGLLFPFNPVDGQKSNIVIPDTVMLREVAVSMEKAEAMRYLEKLYRRADYWNNPSGDFRKSLGQLLYQLGNPSFDSAEKRLRDFPYDSIRVPYERFYIWDTLKIEFPFDVKDSLQTTQIDSMFSGVHSIRKDTIILVVVDTLTEVSSMYKGSLFRHYNHPYEADTIVAAISTLLKEVEKQDTTTMFFESSSGKLIPVMSNSKLGEASRVWLRNEFNDSITVWVGSDRRDIYSLFIEDGVVFRRAGKQTNISGAQVSILNIDHSKLTEVKKVYVKPVYWKVKYETNFILNQTFLSNWVKGGESNLSMVGDITGFADYVKKEDNLVFNNFARLKYGLVASTENGVRKNIDLLETSSKLNKKAFGKFDFSSTAQIKTQLDRGYSYPNDSVIVSKFLNPTTITMGFGLDYKPTKELSINIAPLTYKVTFVTDTITIDQTKYGIEADRKARHEPGVGVMVNHKFTPYETVQVSNRIQLFTNYINKPQNIDIDWEMTVTMKLNWFTDIRLNTHFIYDDDTKTKIFAKDGTAVLGGDGLPKKVARVQFKEVLGFSFVFRF